MSDDVERSRARKFINDLRVRRSGGSEEERRQIIRDSPGLGPSLLEGFDEARQQLGSLVIMLSDELNRKPTHFVYELIQNAEDNKYERSEDPPFLRFHVTPHRITVDSNEDGFEEENVEALCSVRKSTKKSQSGFIGEKGIGFKSVFKLARRATIQSGPFAFYLEDDENATPPGMGMITPHNVPADLQSELPAGVRTRITLDLKTRCNMEQFRELPTLLLFLEKLEELSFRLEYDGSTVDELKYSIFKNDKGDRAEITEVYNGKKTKRRFILAIEQAIDMPIDPRREHKRSANVLLAFPVDDRDIPVETSEYVYAFLPLFRIGFPFLVQSDFITSANREDVDDCAWNRHLLGEIARIFVKSTLDLRRRRGLKYKWVRYIPITPVVDEFWQILQNHILERLRRAQIFETMYKSYKRPAALRKVTAIYRDQDKQPLLPDLAHDVHVHTAYLSDGYEDKDIEVLGKLGTRTLSPEEFIARLEVNLECPTPRMDDELHDSEWQRLCATTILSCAADEAILEKLKSLRLIPLTSRDRICSLNNSIVYPQCGGISVPTDLKTLKIIRQEAFDVIERKRLFVKLGAYECEPTTVFGLIEDQYRSDSWRQAFWHKHIAHVRFCFWHHKVIPRDGLDLQFVYFNRGRWTAFDPKTDRRWVYSHATTYANAPANIFDEDFRAQSNVNIILLPEDYISGLKDLATRNGKGAVTWLEQLLEVKKYVQPHTRRTAFDAAVPSHELELVAKHRSNMLLSVLQPYGDHLAANSKWRQTLSAMKIPTLYSTSHTTLGNATVPRPELVSKIKELGLEQNFGFVQELDSLREDQYASWSFLQKFGLKHEASLEFWFYVIKHACTQKAPISTYNKLFHELQAFAGKRDEIRNFLNSAPMIRCNDLWYLLRDCIWATDDVQIPDKASIASQFARMQFFFVTLLGVQPPSLGMHLQALIQTSASNTRNKTDMIRLMLNVCAFQPGRDEVAQLLNHSIFPTKTSDGRLVWKSAVDSFGILDRLEHQRVFDSHFDRLDLTIEEIHQVKVLLIALGLENRWSSRTVSESTAVRGSRPSLSMTTNFQAKAYAICRFLTHGRSPRCSTIADTKSLLRQLEEAQVHESDSISKLLSITIEDKLYSVASDQASCHVAVADGKLTLYLPSDPSLHHTFLADELPQKLLEHFGAIQGDHTFKLGHVMTAISLDAVDRLLERYGIIKCEGVERSINNNFTFRMTGPSRNSSPLTPETSSSSAAIRSGGIQSSFGLNTPFTSPATVSSGSLRVDGSRSVGSLNELSNAIETLAIGAGSSSRSVPRQTTPITGSDQNGRSTASSQSEAVPGNVFNFTGLRNTASVLMNTSTPQQSFTFSTLNAAEAYKQLLEYVVRVSRLDNYLVIPRMGQSSVGAPGLSSGIAIDFALTNPSGYERDNNKVGAAGELMMFEILSRLGLHEFSRSEWQSKIRVLVNVLDDYKDLRPYSTIVETADIVYHDRNNELFKILKAKGHFDPDHTPSDPYIFQIEVKTSTSNLETEFFVSQRQVNLMENTRTGGTVGQSKICYIIARVFNLGRKDMGLALFVNPAKLRDEGLLIFESTSYKVRPGNGWNTTRR